MSSVAADTVAGRPSSRPSLDRKPNRTTVLLFLGLLAIGVGFTGYSLVSDISRGACRSAWRCCPSSCWESRC